MADGADLLPWAVNMLLEWHADDPVSRKELERNGTVYTMQGNRNPFIDRPEFAAAMYVTTGVDWTDGVAFRLHQNFPNPFNPATTMSFSLSGEAEVELSVHDVSGRHVATLASGIFPAGRHSVVWGGRAEGAGSVASGVYFCRLLVGEEVTTVKMILLK